MPPLPSLASHGTGRIGLKAGRGEGNRQRPESEALTRCADQTSLRLALVEAPHAGTCAHSEARLVSRKSLKSHIKTLM